MLEQSVQLRDAVGGDALAISTLLAELGHPSDPADASSNSRRRGVGQLLVEAAKRWARDHGCVRLSVTSAERRADAHAFYPACGLP